MASENESQNGSSLNATVALPNRINDYFIVCSFSGFCALCAVAISLMILILVWRTKNRLHTVRHLLICNTSVASILYCVVQIINYSFLIFFPSETSDIGCRWRAYFAYMTICAVTYSYLIQAISRLFITLLAKSYRFSVTFRAHYCLILVQWSTAVLLPLPAIITKDIYFRPRALCWVPLKNFAHVTYTYLTYYLLPALSICVIYCLIYYRVKKAAKHASIEIRSLNSEKRDLELLRNILILIFIYFSGGIPTMLFIVSTNRILYLIGIVSISFTVAVEKGCAIILDRDLYQIVRNLLARRAQVLPESNANGIGIPLQNITKTKRIVPQASLNVKHLSVR